MNRFEAMLAPPTLSNKEMAMHVKMQTAISRDEANSFRAEMLVPEVRLYDELTTLRFRRPGPDEKNTAYRKFCGIISGASGKPIPYRFFKGEFEKILDDIGVPEGARGTLKSLKADQAQKAVDSLSDPWRIQAYAALCARIAESSETEDPKNAASAWDKAFTLYGRFFSAADVSQSTTYKVQTEEKFKEDTATAWKGFRAQLAEGIVSRIRDYIRDGKPDSVTACIDALGTASIRAVDSTAVERALGDSLVPYVNALKAANSLNDAAKLYDNIPKQLVEKDTRQECVRAMLSAMSDEVDRLQKSGNNITVLIKWIGKLRVENLYKTGTPLVKKSAGDFYEKCANYVRDVINGDKHNLAKYADNLVALIPEDIVIARAGDSKPLYRKDVIGMCTTTRIRSEYMSKFENIRSRSEAKEMGAAILKEINNTPMVGVPQKELKRHLMQNLLVTLQQSKMDPSLQLAFLETYPDDQPIVDETLKTVGGFKKMLQGAGIPFGSISPGLKALADFAQAEEGTDAQMDALQRVIDYAVEHPGEDVNGDKYYTMAEACCRNAFIGALNKKDSVGDYTFRQKYKPVMELAASFLPSDYKFPAGGGKTVELGLLVIMLDLSLSGALSKKADAARKKINIHGGGSGGFGGFGGGNRRVRTVPPDYYSKVIGQLLAKVLPPLALLGILTLIGHFRGGLPTALEFIRMLLKISVLFYIPIGIATGCVNNKTPHPRFWRFILVQGYLLSGPVAFYNALKFFNALPMKLWAIIVCIIYGIIYVLATIGTLLSKD